MFEYILLGIPPKTSPLTEEEIKSFYTKIAKALLKCYKEQHLSKSCVLPYQDMFAYLIVACENLKISTTSKNHEEYIRRNFTDQNLPLKEIKSHLIWKQPFRLRLFFAVLLAHEVIDNKTFFSEYQTLKPYVKKIAQLYHMKKFLAFSRQNNISWQDVFSFIINRGNFAWNVIIEKIKCNLENDLAYLKSCQKEIDSFCNSKKNLKKEKLFFYLTFSCANTKTVLENEIFSVKELLKGMETPNNFLNKVDLLAELYDRNYLKDKQSIPIIKKIIMCFTEKQAKEHENYLCENELPHPELKKILDQVKTNSNKQTINSLALEIKNLESAILTMTIETHLEKIPKRLRIS